MIFEQVPPAQRLLAAMKELLAAARALSEDPTDGHAISQRRWALRLAERGLRELGGLERLEAAERERVEAIARRVAAYDAATQELAETLRDRLLHARAETRRRSGRQAGLMDWAA